MPDTQKAIKSKYEMTYPSGKCRMGDIDVTVYAIGEKMWFEKKAIELVLTGRNQHNLMGQYKDPKNHLRVFDYAKNGLVDIISKAGIENYLKDARSIKDEARRDYYAGLAAIRESPSKTEPLQMPFDAKIFSVPSVRITKVSDGYNIDSYTNDKKELIGLFADCIKMLLEEEDD